MFIRKKSAFTLLEILISLTITVIITAVLVINLNSSLDLWQQGSSVSKSIQQSDLSLHWIEKDLRELKFLDYAGDSRLVLRNSLNDQIIYNFLGNKLLRIFNGFDGTSSTDTVLTNVSNFKFTYRDRLQQIIPNPQTYPNSGISPLDCYMVNLIGVALTVVRNDVEFDLWTSVKLGYRPTPPVRNISFNPFLYYMRIQDALADPNLDYGQIIQVSAGTYYTNLSNQIIVSKNITLKGGYNNPNWIQDLSLPEHETIIYGQDLKAIYLNSTLDYVLIEGFTLTNAETGILIDNFNSSQAGLFIQKCKFDKLGKGIYLQRSGKISILENEFTNNNIGVLIGGGNDPLKEILISNNIFGKSQNENLMCAIAMESKDNVGKIRISNNKITNNGKGSDPPKRGGILMQLRNQGDISITNNLFQKNKFKKRKDGATYYPGGAGAITLFSEPPVFFGPPYDSQPFNGTLSIRSNIIEDNQAEVVYTGAGAIFIGKTLSPSILIENNIITKNNLKVKSPSDFGAAAIAIRQVDRSLFIHKISNNDIIQNETNFDSVIFLGDLLTMANFIVNNNLIKDNISKKGKAPPGSKAAAIRVNNTDLGRLSISNNLIVSNKSGKPTPRVGGIWIDDADIASAHQNTIYDNQFGLGSKVLNPNMNAQNNISWGNGDDDYDLLGDGIYSNKSYFRDPETQANPPSDILGNVDPFVDAAGGDFHITNAVPGLIDISSVTGEQVPPGLGTSRYDAGCYGGNNNRYPIGSYPPIGPTF